MSTQLLIIIVISIIIGILSWSNKNERKAGELKSELELSPIDFKQKFENLKISGGTLRFWGNWFGRPMDNYHQIKNVEYDSVAKKLILILDEGEKIKIWKPSELKLGKTELRIEKANKILFEWHSYGENKIDKNLRFESYTNNGIKIEFETDFRDKKQKANCNLKEPAFRIIGM